MNKQASNILRWIFLAPVVLALFYLCVLVSIGLYQLTDTLASSLLCSQPSENYQACIDYSLGWVKESLLFLMPAIAAVLMIYSAYWIAPSYKLGTAVCVFALGFLAAISYALESGYWHTLAIIELLSGLALFHLFMQQITQQKD